MADLVADQTPKTHGCPADTDHDQEVPEIDLLSPLMIRGVTLRNRIVMSPMCQYIAREGLADDWHLVHLGSRAAGGVALAIVEATAVTRDGRITHGDLGIWSDDHVPPLARIARFVHSQWAVAGIQLAHAGRKASCDLPWKGGAGLKTPDVGGWPVVGPSPIPFDDGNPVPKELDEAGIDGIVAAFEAATRRALAAGFRVIEIHSAHGYLLHEFLSPLSNRRGDQYGGTLENRMRLPLRVAAAVRKLVPADLPVFIRISATDWADGGWDVDQSVVYACKLKELGIDLVDVSSGGLIPRARIPVGKGYQVPLARKIRHEAGVMTGAVGLITEVSHANEIVTGGDADLVFLAREWAVRPRENWYSRFIDHLMQWWQARRVMYQLNLVFADGTRLHLTDWKNRPGMQALALRLAEFLNVPLTIPGTAEQVAAADGGRATGFSGFNG
jgi:2,4-dienoyl-CoA reductase-like NADH-dependent reductase (Old Yellow Enzyme family)